MVTAEAYDFASLFAVSLVPSGIRVSVIERASKQLLFIL
jgi:hypothetical protein